MRFCCLLLAILCAGLVSGRAQAIGSATCGDDGAVHLAFTDGTSRNIAKDADQAGCEDVQISADHHAAGWRVLEENCCTSYPVATGVKVLRDGMTRLFQVDQSLWAWRFAQQDTAVAILSGPTHGNAGAAVLFRLNDGTQIARWTGRGKAPAWAADWAERFRAPR